MGDSVLRQKKDWVVRVIRGGGAKDDAVTMQTRSYNMDLSPRLKELMSVSSGASKSTQDWWESIMSHLPPCRIAVDVQAASPIWEKTDANMILEHTFGRAAEERISAGLPKLASSLRTTLLRTEAGIPPLAEQPVSKKTQDAIDARWAAASEECSDLIEQFQDGIAEAVSEEVQGTIKEIKKTKTEIKKYQAVAVARVVKGVTLIAGNIAHAAASWGATSPLAIVLIARQCVEIAQIVGKGMSDAEDLSRLVIFDLKTIKTFYTDEGKGKARNNAAEVAAGVVSGVLALEIPSVKNCTTHIGDFDHKVRLVEMDYLGMGRKLKKLSDKIADLEAKIAAAKGGERIHKKLTNAEATKEYEAAMAEFGKTFTTIFETVPQVMNQIKEYKANSKEWKETLKGYSDRTDGWTEYVPALAAFATEAGMGIGHVSGEHVVGAAEIASQHIKVGVEVSTVVLNGTLDKFLEDLND